MTLIRLEIFVVFCLLKSFDVKPSRLGNFGNEVNPTIRQNNNKGNLILHGFNHSEYFAKVKRERIRKILSIMRSNFLKDNKGKGKSTVDNPFAEEKTANSQGIDYGLSKIVSNANEHLKNVVTDVAKLPHKQTVPKKAREKFAKNEFHQGGNARVTDHKEPSSHILGIHDFKSQKFRKEDPVAGGKAVAETEGIKMPEMFEESKQCSKKCGISETSHDYESLGQSRFRDESKHNKPWLAKISIRYFKDLSYCTGSVINERFIISAAHCFCNLGWCTNEVKELGSDGNEEVLLDTVGSVSEDYGLSFDGEDYGELNGVEKIFFHPMRIKLATETPGYSGYYDVALLLLTKPLDLSDKIHPICLPFDTRTMPASENQTFSDHGVEAFVAGFGLLQPSQEGKCLTSQFGPSKFHMCATANVYTKCLKSKPPRTFQEICNISSCANISESGPFGWCQVETFKDDGVDAKKWGFCTPACEEPVKTPTVFHAQTEITVLTKERCVKLLEDMFLPPSSNFHPDLELCAGKQNRDIAEIFMEKSKKNETRSKRSLLTTLNHSLAKKPDAMERLMDGDVIKRITASGETVYIKFDEKGLPHIMEKRTETGQRLTAAKMFGVIGGADACKGDSGGPLWVLWDNRAVLIGVVSRGKVCATYNRPGIYSRIATSLSWIYETTKNYGCYTM